MKLVLEIDSRDLAHAILEDRPCAEWNINETHSVLNALRNSVVNLSEIDKISLCQILNSYYSGYSREWKPEDLTIENIGKLSETI